ncbi:transcriptional regulator [Hydrogenophaga crassostreae]|uniref:Transcriptional regulator n=1 Tax=Hydrogenophaga crassostreae TaxID=1763535 RepID=A0A167I258_9BURK|nr:Rrf2 family transcriptional regulator [Hydrogenophaga crassostreae]AOW13733.1 transcriptional regulator [Hydrogenophaga crassostreae]OAD42030.1 transcriptional regulator [Hydrogenophaga crassostreae]
MKQNNQLSDVLHVLLHMAEGDGPATSETLAAAMKTNPVVLRRLMSGLRNAGFVASAKGHGGGWVLSCALERITLADVYQALGAPKLVSLGFREENPSCLVALAVNDALAGAAQEAEALLLKRFGAVTLATLSADFHRRMAQHRVHGHSRTHQLEDHIHENI